MIRVFIFAFCFLFSFVSLATTSNADKASGLSQEILQLKQEIGELKTTLQDCRSCASEKVLLSQKEALLEAKEAESNHYQREATLDNIDAQKQESAKDQVTKQKRKTKDWAVINGIASALFFMRAKKAAGTPAAAYWEWAGMATGGLAAALAIQYLTIQDKEKKFSDRSNSLQNEENPEPENPCNTPICKKITDLIETNPSPGELQGGLNEILGCPPADCPSLDSLNGPEAPNGKNGIKVKRGSDLFKNLNPSQQKAVKKMMDDIKAKEPHLFDEEEEETEEASTSDPSKSFGAFQPGNRLIGSVSEIEGEKKRKRKSPDTFKKFQSLFDQFKKKKITTSGKTVTVGKDKVGVIEDNIFLLMHRRYQERRKNKQFIEGLKKYSRPSRQQI